MNAKMKLLSLNGVLFSLVILLITSISYINFKSSSEDNYTHALNRDAFLVSHSLELKMQEYFSSLTLVSKAIEKNIDNNFSLSLITKELAAIENEFNVNLAFLGTKDGITYLPSGQIPDFNAKTLNREWYTRAFSGEKKIITTPYSNHAGELVMSIVVPVSHNEDIVAALGFSLPVDAVTQFISGLTTHNQIFVSRDDGFILGAQDLDNIGKNLYQIRPSYAEFKDTTESSHYYEFNQEEYFVVSEKVKHYNWTVWAWDSQANISAASTHNLLVTGALTLLFILITIGCNYLFVAKLIYAPIGGEPTEIEKMVKQVAEGDFTLTSKTNNSETGIHGEIFKMSDCLSSIAHNIDNASNRLNSSSEIMGESAAIINHSAEQQMEQLEQTSAAMNEMTMTVDEVAKHTLQASSAAQEAQNLSRQGMTVVEEMNQNISNLVAGIDNVVDVTNTLEAETQNIGGILDVINAISDQTNLLALNAAIEAAHAGEHGKGFSVVADEVRNLAERTQESTNEIQKTIEKLQSDAQHSVELMQINVKNARATTAKSDETNSALNEILSSVSLILDMNSQIATAAEEQTLVAAEINNSVVEISDMAKATYDKSNGFSKRAKTLSDISLSLSDSIKEMTF